MCNRTVTQCCPNSSFFHRSFVTAHDMCLTMTMSLVLRRSLLPTCPHKAWEGVGERSRMMEVRTGLLRGRVWARHATFLTEPKRRLGVLTIYKNHPVGNFRYKHKTIKCEVAGEGIIIKYIHIS